jgi:hypothetical protein
MLNKRSPTAEVLAEVLKTSYPKTLLSRIMKVNFIEMGLKVKFKTMKELHEQGECGDSCYICIEAGLKPPFEDNDDEDA